VAADVLAGEHELAAGAKSPVACIPPVASKAGWRRRAGSAASTARGTTGPGGSGAAWKATSSSAPLPQTPHELVV
jgi:hypothetical protein